MKEKWKRIGFLCLHCLAVVVLACLCELVSLIGTRYVRSAPGIIFTTSVYQVFLPCYILGLVLFAVGYTVLWKKYLQNDFYRLMGYGLPWGIGGILLGIVVLALLFFSDLMVFIYVIGIFVTIGTGYEDVLFLFPMIYAVVFSVGSVLVKHIRQKRIEGGQDNENS